MDKALELADWLENHVCGRETTKEVITMLRQQQAEIEALKKHVAFLEDKAIMVEPLDDSHYPFRAILRKAQENV